MGTTVMIVLFFITAAVLLITIALVIILYTKMSEMKRTQQKLEDKFEGEAVEDLFYKMFEQQDEVLKELKENREVTEALKESQKYSLNRVGIIRYNASKDAGAKLSYSVGLSSDSGDGLVITGLHYNDGVNIYVKKITDGSSDVTLSKEEEAALDRSKLN